MKQVEYCTIVGESPVIENINIFKIASQVGRDTWNPFWICEDHLVRLNIPEQPVVNQYREGKVKRTPEGEWKEHETESLQAVEGRL